MLKLLTNEALLKLFDVSVHAAIAASVKRNKATHIVVAECEDFNSSNLGARTAMCVGPTCTYKTPQECDGKWLHDLPSQRQYFNAYAEVPVS